MFAKTLKKQISLKKLYTKRNLNQTIINTVELLLIHLDNFSQRVSDEKSLGNQQTFKAFLKFCTAHPLFYYKFITQNNFL